MFSMIMDTGFCVVLSVIAIILLFSLITMKRFEA